MGHRHWSALRCGDYVHCCGTCRFQSRPLLPRAAKDIFISFLLFECNEPIDSYSFVPLMIDLSMIRISRPCQWIFMCGIFPSPDFHWVSGYHFYSCLVGFRGLSRPARQHYAEASRVTHLGLVAHFPPRSRQAGMAVAPVFRFYTRMRPLDSSFLFLSVYIWGICSSNTLWLSLLAWSRLWLLSMAST